MKKFTLKDFIAYNNPCFSCGNPISFRIVSTGRDGSAPTTQIRPTVTISCTEIYLRITFKNALKLGVVHKTNKIYTNDKKDLTEYLERYTLALSSTCDSCYTHISSASLDFDLDRGVLKAVEIAFERLLVDDNENHYRINSFYETGKSDVVIDKTNQSGVLTPIILDLPLIPRSSFKNKRHFIKKLKTYALFS